MTTLDQMVQDFKVARHRRDRARFGSTEYDRANAKLDALVRRAERIGFVDVFVRKVNA